MGQPMEALQPNQLAAVYFGPWAGLFSALPPSPDCYVFFRGVNTVLPHSKMKLLGESSRPSSLLLPSLCVSPSLPLIIQRLWSLGRSLSQRRHRRNHNGKQTKPSRKKKEKRKRMMKERKSKTTLVVTITSASSTISSNKTILHHQLHHPSFLLPQRKRKKKVVLTIKKKKKKTLVVSSASWWLYSIVCRTLCSLCRHPGRRNLSGLLLFL